MDFTALLIAMLSMGGLGALFSLGLALADLKLRVDEDPRISLVIETLPGANCGGCGLPGCAAFAEQVVSDKIELTGCPVNTPEGVEDMAAVMGVEVELKEREVARVRCLGGSYEAAKKGHYDGISTCVAADLAKGGDKLCEYGCMGHADCTRACPFDAIHMNDNNIPVVDTVKCTGCNNCAVACPRDIIEIHPESRNLFVLCKSQDEAKYAKTVCTVSCVGCGACAKGAEEGLMIMENNIPVINYDIQSIASELPTLKCPNKSLTLLQTEEKLVEDLKTEQIST